ncbi:hypothetical protein [Nesterenkonia pannonica]|uniref:hypothetical protein n=1 Tax=Nesterenkonia pannonica TaxID=1548602 RepID=UPI0021643539|nr:hypothetical protein [Nesterenkonia pannonica]
MGVGPLRLPLVVKPFNASQGRGVHIGIETRERFIEAFTSVGEQYGEVLVENFLPGTEHRALVVDNSLVAVTRRVPAHVVGDGASTVEELIAAKNRRRGLIHKPLRTDDSARANLQQDGLSPASVPPRARLLIFAGRATFTRAETRSTPPMSSTTASASSSRKQHEPYRVCGW